MPLSRIAGVFIPNPNFERAFEVTEGAGQDSLEESAEKVKEIAEDIAPRSDSQGEHYADAFEVVRDDEGHVYLINKDFKANWIEFGTKNWAPHGTMRAAAEAAGCRIDTA